MLRISKNSRWLDYDRTIQTSTINQIRLTLTQMKNDAKADITLRITEYTLRQIAQHADLSDPENVEHYIANGTTKDGNPVSAETKNKWRALPAKTTGTTHLFIATALANHPHCCNDSSKMNKPKAISTSGIKLHQSIFRQLTLWLLPEALLEEKIGISPHTT